MKIRCENNSIRLRLKKSEIEQLRKDGQLQTSVDFAGGGLFSWSIRFDSDTESIQASFENGSIEVRVPEKEAIQWIDTEQVGMKTPENKTPYVLIEKDFPCKDRPWEGKEDFFEELAEKEDPTC